MPRAAINVRAAGRLVSAPLPSAGAIRPPAPGIAPDTAHIALGRPWHVPRPGIGLLARPGNRPGPVRQPGPSRCRPQRPRRCRSGRSRSGGGPAGRRGGGGKAGCRRHGGLPVAGAARVGIGRIVRRGHSRGQPSRGLAGDAAVDASAAFVRLPCGAAARIRRDPDVGWASKVIMNDGHGFSSRMRYATPGKRCVLLMAGDRLGVPATAVAASGDFRCGRRAGKKGLNLYGCVVACGARRGYRLLPSTSCRRPGRPEREVRSDQSLRSAGALSGAGSRRPLDDEAGKAGAA